MSRRCCAALAAIVLLFAGAGCRPDREPVTRLTGIPAPERRFLPPPTEDYGFVVDEAVVREIDQLHRALLAGEDPEDVLVAARALADARPDLHPALVLAAEALLVAERPYDAARTLRPVVDELPDYVPAVLVLGRAEERADRIPEAYALYRRIASLSGAAAARAESLRERAIEIEVGRAESALRRGRVDRAEESLERLEGWAPESEAVLELQAGVARAAGDSEAELGAVWGLLDLRPDDPDLLRRRVELELEVGDPEAALNVAQALAASFPEDPELRELLGRAKLGWRISTLPAEVQEIVGRSELTRAEGAVLLYWLVPGVRAGAGGAPRIATDILEHPHRTEIMRVVNSGLLGVDPGLRQFHPDRPLERIDLFTALLRSFARSREPVACVQPIVGHPSPPRDLICSTANRCGLIGATAECLPTGGLTGGQAVEIIGRALRLM